MKKVVHVFLIFTALMFMLNTAFTRISHSEQDRSEQNAVMSDAPAGLSPEVENDIKKLRSGNNNAMKSVARKAYNSPSTTDPMLYEIMNQLLLDGYKVNIYSIGHMDTMAWLCKALGASGNPAYKKTLEEVSTMSGISTLKKHARKSLSMLQ